MDYDRWKAEVNVRYQRMKVDAQSLIDQVRSSGEDLKESMAPKIEQLKAQQKKFESRLTELQKKGGAGWDTMKQGLEQSLEEIESSYRQARQEMKQK